MAQVLKLKKTAVNCKIPNKSNLELGELAMNTFDGRIFLKKDSGTPIVNEVLTTNTEGSITGSLNLNGNITASNLTLSGNAIIDGNITLGGNITIGDNVADVVTVTAGFSGSLIPETTSLYDLGSSTKKWNNLHVVTASADYFIGDGSQLTNVVAEVSQVATVTSSFQSQDQIIINHNFSSRNIHVSVYDDSNQLLIPENVTLTTTNPNVKIVILAAGGTPGAGGGGATKAVVTFTPGTVGVANTITHNLGTNDIIVQLWDVDTGEVIIADINNATSTDVDIIFGANPTGDVKAVII